MKAKPNLVFNINFLGFYLNRLSEHSLNIFWAVLWYLENLFVIFLNHQMELKILQPFVLFCFYKTELSFSYFQ